VLRPMRRDRLRTALTLAGVAVGVAVIVAIQLANRSALRAFRQSVDAVAGRANYQIVGDAGFVGEELLVRLRPLWREDVRFAPVIDVDGVATPGGDSQVPVRLLAVDLLSDLHFRDYRYAKIVVAGDRPASLQLYFELFRHDSAIVPETFAREHGLKLGSPLPVSVFGRRQTMIVRGILEAHGPATAFNGSIVVCDIAAAQASFGLTGRLSRIDLRIPEERAGRLVAAAQRLLPPSARIERPSRRSERVEKMLRAFRVNLFALGGVALLLGMFLVYNTVLISILRRRRDVGVLKTVGAPAGRIFGAFLLEGLLLGIAGSAIGIALGRALAWGILRVVGRTINSLYVASTPEEISLGPGVAALGMAVGTILALLSSIQPSQEAARVRPDLLIRPGLHQRLPAGRAGRLGAGAAICFLAAAGFSLLPPAGGVAIGGYVAVLFVVGGFSLLAPLIVRTTAAALAPPARRLFGIVGHLAAASLPASLRRTAIASAALSLAIGMMVAVALMVGSFRSTVAIWVRQTVTSDLWLRPAKGLSNAQAALFPPAILDDLRRFPFVKAFDPVRGRDVLYGDSLVTVAAGDFETIAEYGDLPMVRPRSPRAALGEALRRGGVLVSESFAVKFGKDAGSRVTIPTPSGPRSFPVAGVYRDYSSDRGAVVMDREIYVPLFHDDAINTIVVYLREGTRLDDARRVLERSLGPKYMAFTVSNAEVRREVMRIFDQTFSITWALLGIAVVVAVLGIVNTLSALILERTRELAMLRITGMTTGELRTMLLLESVMLGLASTVAGTVMGYALSTILIYVINRQSFGWTIEFHTPAAVIAASLAATFAASALAGLVPARIAGRIDIAAAIKTE
ncbi:MAG TPA: FtsX-like permease family protein, partial [Thermoanaerobaculia bacterium]|nr:FtsX-like permease family protein [Thermoanaerobaculia bacterium]